MRRPGGALLICRLYTTPITKCRQAGAAKGGQKYQRKRKYQSFNRHRPTSKSFASFARGDVSTACVPEIPGADLVAFQ